MPILTYAQLEALWVQAGGSQASAPTAAAVALAESGGDSGALNPDACRSEASACQPCNLSTTGDYSVGLWQINYFGALFDTRKAAFGCPAGLYDPLANARAAVSLSGGGSSFAAWSTYTSGAYRTYLQGTAAPRGLGGPIGRHVVVSRGDDTGARPGEKSHHLTFAWHTLVGAIKDTLYVRANKANEASRGYKGIVRQLGRK